MTNPVRTTVLLAGLCAATAAAAQPDEPWAVGAVLDATHTTRALALGTRDAGLQLGHSDLSAAGPVGRHARARLTATFETHDGDLERRVEEAWLETTALPAGMQARAGRFASQVGRLNEQHLHADDFVERPLLYRAFLGGHWNDDGLRLNWTAPTDVYLMVGAEAFRGRKLVAQAANDPRSPGAATLVAKVGADVGRAHSWLLGLSHIRNRREAPVEEAHDDGEGEDPGDEPDGHDDADPSGHAHQGARFTGRRTWMVDATWKWAPDGNNLGRQLRVSFEAARVTQPNRYAGAGDRHVATALSAVWRWHPSWELGARTDRLRARVPHGDHFDDGRLREHAVMVAWKPTHQQTLRLQYTTQRDATAFDDAAKRAVQLQYVLGFGAHGSHAY